jgi:hypothetical protein
LEEEEEGDISLTAPVTAWKRNYGPKPNTQAPKATHASEGCIFCKSKDHFTWQCPKTVSERRKIALQLSKCLNCINLGCPGGEACTARYFCKHCAAAYPATPKHSGYLCTQADNPRFSNGRIVLEKPKSTTPAASGASSSSSKPAASSGKTWNKNPKATYVAKTEKQAATIAASVASLQEAVRDMKQHHETITAETTVKSADKVLEN